MQAEAVCAVRLRRRQVLLVRIADEPTLDIAKFLRGSSNLDREVSYRVLCPASGKALPVLSTELGWISMVPCERWVGLDDLEVLRPHWGELVGLAQRGLLLADPPADSWETLEVTERTIRETQWNELAAVFHAHTRWQGARGKLAENRSDKAHQERLELVRSRRGDPPPHFVRRSDALSRSSLETPRLDGPFFDVLLSRTTTRAYLREEPLPMSKLSTVLYAVFAAHGIKEFAPGISAIRRTSPSGGALHPVEAYVLSVKVEGLASGIYHYESGTHSLALLESLGETEARQTVSDFTAGQSYFADAHAIVIHVARFDRNLWKYVNHRKAYKTVLMDSAHLSQTLYLTATHLGLGAFYTAAINDEDIGSRLRLDPMREAAVAISGIGIRDQGRDDLHFVASPYFPTELSRGEV